MVPLPSQVTAADDAELVTEAGVETETVPEPTGIDELVPGTEVTAVGVTVTADVTFVPVMIEPLGSPEAETLDEDSVMLSVMGM